MTLDDDIEAIIAALQAEDFTPREGFTLNEIPWHGRRAPDWDDLRAAMRHHLGRDEPRPEHLNGRERKVGRT